MARHTVTACPRAVLLIAISVNGGCAAAPRGTSINDPELLALLRPNEPITSEQLIQSKDQKLYYIATLRDGPSPNYVDEYLAELAGRGLSLKAEGSSPHLPLQHRTGYTAAILQEASQKPYSIRYKTAWDGEEATGHALRSDYPQAITLAGRELTFRLGRDLLRPWHTAVVVPEENLASLPFPIPLPAKAVVLAVDEEHSDEFVDGRFRPSSGPTGIKVDFLADTPPSEVFSFYKQTLSPPGEVIRRDDHRLTLAFGPQYPPWAPRPMHILYAAVQSYLFATPDGIVVPIPRLVSGCCVARPRARFVPPRMAQLVST